LYQYVVSKKDYYLLLYPKRLQNLFVISSYYHVQYLFYLKFYLLIYLLNAVGFSPGGSSTVHIYTQTIHRTTQNKQYIE